MSLVSSAELMAGKKTCRCLFSAADVHLIYCVNDAGVPPAGAVFAPHAERAPAFTPGVVHIRSEQTHFTNSPKLKLY